MSSDNKCKEEGPCPETFVGQMALCVCDNGDEKENRCVQFDDEDNPEQVVSRFEIDPDIICRDFDYCPYTEESMEFAGYEGTAIWPETKTPAFDIDRSDYPTYKQQCYDIFCEPGDKNCKIGGEVQRTCYPDGKWVEINGCVENPMCPSERNWITGEEWPTTLAGTLASITCPYTDTESYRMCDINGHWENDGEDDYASGNPRCEKAAMQAEDLSKSGWVTFGIIMIALLVFLFLIWVIFHLSFQVAMWLCERRGGGSKCRNMKADFWNAFNGRMYDIIQQEGKDMGKENKEIDWGKVYNTIFGESKSNDNELDTFYGDSRL
jgi:hypothetical protein